ncbi:MAG: hypothetical protein KJP19_05070, partial [Deltaproteobacteria bacterium]|nr:hypothetical protein [Deltaproteobacteria bacterium]
MGRVDWKVSSRLLGVKPLAIYWLIKSVSVLVCLPFWIRQVLSGGRLALEILEEIRKKQFRCRSQIQQGGTGFRSNSSYRIVMQRRKHQRVSM